MGLLAYPGGRTGLMRYQRLYSQSRWTDLLAFFRQTFLSLYSLPPLPLLHLTLSAGLACLKTPTCRSTIRNKFSSPSGSTVRGSSGSSFGSRLPGSLGGSGIDLGDSTMTTSGLNYLRSTTDNYVALTNALSSSPPLGGLPIPGAFSPSSSLTYSSRSVNVNTGTSEDTTDPDPAITGPGAASDNGSKSHFVIPEPVPSASCPLCHSSLGVLGPEVPNSHHSNSTIVCAITGKVCEGGGDELLALPNGRVYSREALEEMAQRYEGKVRCPRTGDMFLFSELKKVFIS